MSLHALFTPDMGEKIFVRRFYFDQSVSKEALLTLKELLSSCPLTSSKKELSRLKGGKMSFSCYAYGKGYVLEGRLSLVENKNVALTYLFVHPEKEALSIFADAFSLGFQREEKEVSLAKERVKRNVTQGSLQELEQEISLPFSPLKVDKEKLDAITLKDVESLFVKLKENKMGDTLYLGREEKEEILSLLPSFEEELPIISEGNLIPSLSSSDETLALYFSFKPLQNEKDYLSVYVSLSSIQMALQEHFSKQVGFDISYETSLLSPSSAVIFLTTKKGKIEMVKDKLPQKIEKEKYLLDALLEEKVQALKNNMSSSLALLEMEKRISLSIPTNETVLKECDLSKEDVLPLLSSFALQGGSQHD